MIAEHATALLSPIQSAPPAGVRVFDEAVDPNTVPPYVVAYVVVTTPEEASLEDVADRVSATGFFHSVGASSAARRNLAGWVFNTLVGVRPEIAGRDCGRIRLIDSQQQDVNEETGQRVHSQVDVFRFFSVPG